MIRFIASLNPHPRYTAILGSISGWFSVENIAQAKDWAQLFAALVAGLVSLCALILTAPAAIAKVRGWFTR